MNLRKAIVSKQQRDMRGSMPVVFILGFLLAIFLISAIGVDVTHNITTRTAMQNASDAAAIAGAARLVLEDVQTSIPAALISAPSSSMSAGQAYADATSVGGSNLADGRPVINSSANSALTPTFNQPGSANAGQNVPSNSGQCLVNASMVINNMFASLVGHPTDTVNVASVATGYTTVNAVNQNTVFPIAVSLDSLTGHDTATATSNRPLNAAVLNVGTASNPTPGSVETFTLKEPCSNAAWTTFNTGKDAGTNQSAVDQAALVYVNKAIASALGLTYSPGLIPPQSVGESSFGGTANGGIDLLGDIANTTDISKKLVGQTVVLPVVAGDLPYWNNDPTGTGSQFSPGAGQSRPLLGFIALQVTGVTNDATDNSLQSITGVLVKSLIKGAPGQAQPLVNPDPTQQAADINALDNLSPGTVMLGASNLMNISSPQINSSSYYTGHVPNNPNIGTPATSGSGSQAIQTLIQTDYTATGNNANEGANFQNPPTVTGSGFLAQSFPNATATGAKKFTDTIMINPGFGLTIQFPYTDETGLNPGVYITGHGTTNGATEPQFAPRCILYDTNGTQLQNYTPSCSPSLQQIQSNLEAGKPTSQVMMTFVIPGTDLPAGEHLLIVQTHDADVTHGSANGSGDPFDCYFDLINPACGP